MTLAPLLFLLTLALTLVRVPGGGDPALYLDAQDNPFFLTGSFYDEPVRDVEDAWQALEFALPLLGQEEVTLAYQGLLEVDGGLQVYTFHQLSGGSPLPGAVVKLVAGTGGEGTGKALCLISSLEAETGTDAGDEEAEPATKGEAKEILSRAKTVEKTLPADGRTFLLPLLKDGDTYSLGDAGRGILCASYYEYAYLGRIVPLRVSLEDPGEEAAYAQELRIYEAFLQITDFFERTGWTSPDGWGTPCVLLMGLCSEDQAPLDNAYYLGKEDGCLLFAFGTSFHVGESVDLIAHETAHAMLEALQGEVFYENATGCINEGFCDIIGNLVQELLEEEGEASLARRWQIGEGGGSPIRSLSSPRAGRQPSFLWDLYYVPPAAYPAPQNDYGGVHTCSSLLGEIGYGLRAAGMGAKDALSYWLLAASLLTPRVELEHLKVLLPWVLETAGYGEYRETLEDLIQKARWGTPLPTEANPGQSLVLVGEGSGVEQDLIYGFYEMDGDDFQTWPEARSGETAISLPPGTFASLAWTFDPAGDALGAALYLPNEGRWECLTREGHLCYKGEGRTLDFPLQESSAFLDALLSSPEEGILFPLKEGECLWLPSPDTF